MKSIFSAALVMTMLLFVNGPAEAQITYFSTSFDDGIPETFSLYDLDQNEPSSDTKKMGFEVGKPWVALKVDKDSVSVAASTSWYKKGATSNDWMVTNGIEIASEKAVVSWRAKASDKSYADGYSVYLSTTGATPEDFDTTAPALQLAKESAEWTEHALSLADYVGQTVYIAFVNDSRDKALLYVDDLFVGVPSKVGFTLDFGRCYDGYGDIVVSGHAFATEQEAVEGFTIGFTTDDGQTISQHFAETLQPGIPVAFTLDETVHVERNQTIAYKAWVESGDDRSELSNRLSAYLWKVVAEEVTGTWCQYCVRGIGAMNYMRQNAPEGFIGIAVHNHEDSYTVPDSMAIPGEEYRRWLMSSYGMSGYPHCVINRNAIFSTDPGSIPAYYEAIKATQENFSGLTLEATVDAEGVITGKTQVFFAKDYTGADFKLAYIVIENDVHRTHAETGILDNYCGYDQINAYAGGAQGACYGFENLPRVVNADDIWYQDVARGYAGNDGYKGEGGLFPANINDGDSFTHEQTLNMPAKVLRWENTELVVLLLSKSGVIVNAEKCPIVVTQPSSIHPSTCNVQRSSFNVYSLSGRQLSDTSRPGIYILRQGDRVRKVMVK